MGRAFVFYAIPSSFAFDTFEFIEKVGGGFPHKRPIFVVLVRKWSSSSVPTYPAPHLHVLWLMVQSPEPRRPDKVRELYQGQHSLVARRRRRRGVSSAGRQVGKLYSLPCSRGGRGPREISRSSAGKFLISDWLSHCRSARRYDCRTELNCQSEKYSGFPSHIAPLNI